MPTPSGDEGAEDSLPDSDLDFLVIGAGPHALSLLCRLIDDEPDLMTEDQRTHMMAKAGTRARAPAAVRAHLKKRFACACACCAPLHGRWRGATVASCPTRGSGCCIARRHVSVS